MRPQDIVVLLKILITSETDWQYRDLADQLSLSVSEISESLFRSNMAGLVDDSRRRVFKQSLMEFIQFGVHYVFPQVPGTMLNGMPTAHSHDFYRRMIKAELNYVWPDEEGWMRGLADYPFIQGASESLPEG